MPVAAPTISGAKWPDPDRPTTVTAWDFFPVHQSSEWIAHPATSDRNFYDRYYSWTTTGVPVARDSGRNARNRTTGTPTSLASRVA